MPRQQSILSFIKKPSPGNNSFGGLLRRDLASQLPNEASDPEIRGTDTPPEKLRCSFFPSTFPATSAGGGGGNEKRSDSLFSSILHKFKRDDGSGSGDERY